MRPSNDKEAITLILDGMAAKGWTVYMVQDDVWGVAEDNVLVSSTDEAVDAITAVDEAFAFFVKGTPPTDKSDGGDGYIYFVLGNEPEEVACDYTTNLDPDLSSITDPWWS